MKKLIILISMMLVASSAFAQKYAFVDSDYILTNIPSYKAAQEQLEKFSADWEIEVKAAYEEVERLYKEFQAEKVLLTDEMRKKKENQIIEKEKAAKELQRKYFGPEGELFKKREELVKPIQDEVYTAVQEIATEGNYALIFDTASGPTILYFNPRYDKSDEVLIKLGYKQ